MKNEELGLEIEVAADIWNGAADTLAVSVARKLDELGHFVRIDGSRQSRSQYVTIKDGETGVQATARFADHTRTSSGRWCEIDVRVGADGWVQAHDADKIAARLANELAAKIEDEA